MYNTVTKEEENITNISTWSDTDNKGLLTGNEICNTLCQQSFSYLKGILYVIPPC